MVPLSIDIPGLVMEGTRRLDEWKAMRERIPSPLCVPVQVAAWATRRRRSGEAKILAMVDDDRTIQEIALQTHSSEFFVCRVLFDQLRQQRLKVVRPRSEGSLSGPDRETVNSEALMSTAQGYIEEGRLRARAAPPQGRPQRRARQPDRAAGRRQGRGRHPRAHRGGRRGARRRAAPDRRRDRHRRHRHHPAGGLHPVAAQRRLRPADDPQDQPDAAARVAGGLLEAAAGRLRRAGRRRPTTTRRTRPDRREPGRADRLRRRPRAAAGGSASPGPGPRHLGVAPLGKAQRPAGRLAGVVDADARPGDDTLAGERLAAGHRQLAAQQRHAVEPPVDGQRLAQLAGAAGQIAGAEPPLEAAVLLHP